MDKKKDTSLVKIEANKRNAKKSTGPKNTSVTRLNAMKHGVLSKEVLIEGEDKKALAELGKKMRLELAPDGELENILVDRIISSVWRLRRAIRTERDYVQAEYKDCKYDSWNKRDRDDDEAWNLVVSKQFGKGKAWLNLMRYETSIEKQIYKALHELMRLQSEKRGENPPLPLAIDVDVSAD
ncbi:hypothetical protein ACFL6S_18280 [Candidatus Poribacteria bacterium]